MVDGIWFVASGVDETNVVRSSESCEADVRWER